MKLKFGEQIIPKKWGEGDSRQRKKQQSHPLPEILNIWKEKVELVKDLAAVCHCSKTEQPVVQKQEARHLQRVHFPICK